MCKIYYNFWQFHVKMSYNKMRFRITLWQKLVFCYMQQNHLLKFANFITLLHNLIVSAFWYPWQKKFANTRSLPKYSFLCQHQIKTSSNLFQSTSSIGGQAQLGAEVSKNFSDRFAGLLGPEIFRPTTDLFLESDLSNWAYKCTYMYADYKLG